MINGKGRESTQFKKYTDIRPITCIARTVVCFDNQGFNNFKIVTLTISEGKVIDTVFSDPHGHFEIGHILDGQNDKAIMNLNNNWHDGDYLKK